MENAPDRDEYVGEFLGIVHGELQGLFGTGPADLRGGHLEEFGVRADGETLSAHAVLVFRDRRFRYARHLWPPDFPLRIKTALFVEHLRERLLTGRHALPDDPEATIVV